MTGKDNTEERIKQLEAVVAELRQAQAETGATAAMDGLWGAGRSVAGAGKRARTGSLLQKVGRKAKRWMLLLAGVVVVGGLLYTVLPHATSPSADVFVTGVHDLNTLATAEAYVMTTIEGQDNKIFGVDLSVDFPGTKRVYFIVVPAKILAGVDLKNVTAQDIQIDEKGKKVTITLPHADFVEEAVQNDKVKVFTDEGFLRPATTAKEGLQLISQEQTMQKLRDEAKQNGVLQIAENNAVKALQGFYKPLGYAVDVKFR